MSVEYYQCGVTKMATVGKFRVAVTHTELLFGPHISNYDKLSPSTHDEFFAYVKEHHGDGMAKFIVGWIEEKLSKDEKFEIEGVDMVIEPSGSFCIESPCSGEWHFTYQAQREIIRRLTANLKAHGEDVSE